MIAPCRIAASPLLIAVALLFGAVAVNAQPTGRGDPRAEVRGVVKSVDATAGTITVLAAEGRQEPTEQTLNLVKDVEVVVGDSSSGRRGAFKAAKLADLIAGTTVFLTLSADKKSVEGIQAEGPFARGVIKNVDAARKTVTLTLAPNRREQEAEEKTYTVAGDAEIGVDDGKGRRFSIKEARFVDLAAGAWVTCRASLDQKELVMIIAEGPTYFGVVKSVDAPKGTVSVSIFGRGEMEEKAVEVAKDALVLLDDGKGRRLSVKEGKLADVPAGASIQVRMSPDGKHATSLRVEGANVQGLVKAVDGKKGTITVLTRVGRDEAQEKTYDLAKDARVYAAGKEAKLEDIKVEQNGPFGLLRLSLDQKTVQSVTIMQPRQ